MGFFFSTFDKKNEKTRENFIAARFVSGAFVDEGFFERNFNFERQQQMADVYRVTSDREIRTCVVSRSAALAIRHYGNMENRVLPPGAHDRTTRSDPSNNPVDHLIGFFFFFSKYHVLY